MSLALLALLAPAAAFSFGQPKTAAGPFTSMPGAYGWASEKGLAYSFGKPFSQQKFPGLVKWVQEAEIKHARVAMLAALGYPVAEVFHPLFGGQINEQSWLPVVVAIGLIESASYIADTENPAETGRYWTFKEDRLPGNIGFDPLGFAKEADLRSEELTVGRV